MRSIGATGRRVLKSLRVEIQPVNKADAPVTAICAGELRLHCRRWTGLLTVIWAADTTLIGTTVCVNLADFKVTPEDMGDHILRKLKALLPVAVERIVATTQPARA